MPDASADSEAAAFVAAAARQVGLEIPPVDLPAVIRDFARIEAIARFLVAFPLDQSVEPAPVFRPVVPRTAA